ncbi:MAG: hypothetical protein ACK40G_15905 [Cytophagaceae bacterium]
MFTLASCGETQQANNAEVTTAPEVEATPEAPAADTTTQATPAEGEAAQ